MSFYDTLSRARVVPVLEIERTASAVPLAKALAAGGLDVLEVTLRTPCAMEAIRRIASEVPEVTVGAGTVTRAQELDAVRDAGGHFAVSPGLVDEVARASRQAELPLLPGVMTPSEALAARDLGFDILKLFPAEVAGGIPLLKALAGPLFDLSFCPTGGIGPANFRNYLKLSNVVCVGGSWVAPKTAVDAEDWPRITRLAQQAST